MGRNCFGKVLMKRKFAYSENLEKLDKMDSRFPVQAQKLDQVIRQDYVNDAKEAPEPDANLVSSELFYYPQGASGLPMHSVAIDIDKPCLLIESRTPGHYHLYIDSLTTWPNYKNLLEALATCGVIEPGYLQAALGAQATYLRKDRWDLYAKIDGGILEEIRQEIEQNEVDYDHE